METYTLNQIYVIIIYNDFVSNLAIAVIEQTSTSNNVGAGMRKIGRNVWKKRHKNIRSIIPIGFTIGASTVGLIL